MSLGDVPRPQGNLLDETPEHARQVRARTSDADEAALAELRSLRRGARCAPVNAARRSSRAGDGAPGLARAVETLCAQGRSRGARWRTAFSFSAIARWMREWAPIPSLLAVAAVHHHLVRVGLRDERRPRVRDGRGARRVARSRCSSATARRGVPVPRARVRSTRWLAADVLHCRRRWRARARELHQGGRERDCSRFSRRWASRRSRAIAARRSGRPSDSIARLIARHFTGTASRIGGIGHRRHRRRDASPPRDGVRGRRGSGRAARCTAASITTASRASTTTGIRARSPTLQHATRERNATTFREFSELVNDRTTATRTLRAMLDFVERRPVRIDDVEPASAIVKRFVTGAMSFGSISARRTRRWPSR